MKFRVLTGSIVIMVVFGALVGCGTHKSHPQRSEIATSGAVASSTLETTRINVAPRLSMEISSSARTSRTTSYNDGRKVISFDVENDESPYTVIVEYYEHGEKGATEVIGVEKQALSADGAKFEEEEFSVKNGQNSRRLDWEQEAVVPWSSEESPSSIPLKCSAVFFDGADGHSYAVYVSGDAKNSKSLDRVRSVLESIVVD